MGLFDSFKRDKKAASTIQETKVEVEQQAEPENVAPEEEPAQEEQSSETIVDEEMVIENIEVVERAPEPEVQEERVEPEFQKIKSYAEKLPVTHVIGQTKIISILNQKGGVGKTTTAINLAAALGEAGKQVLLVDFDPQGNATSGLGIDKSQVERCIYDVLLNDVPIQDVIIPDVSQGLDLAPATLNLAGAEIELVSAIARESRLKDAVGSLRGRYDYIFIDCPPSLGLLTINGLVAADKLIIPIQCEFYALDGVTKLLVSMKAVKERLNPSLEVFGILLTMYDGRTTLAKQVSREVRNYFGKQVFETMIPRTVKLSEAPSYGLPITQYDPEGKGAISYTKLAKEVIERG